MKDYMNYAYVSHRGMVRTSNQDNFYLDGLTLPQEHEGVSLQAGKFTDGESHLFAVFDGMGGEERGEVASYLAAQTLKGWPLQAREAALAGACLEGNRRIVRFAEQERLGTCGTTAAMLLFDEAGAAWCHIGDSRIYRLRDKQLEQLTQDDALPVLHFRKPPLLQHLGIPENEMRIEPHTGTGPAQSGDTYLICTDGLTDMLPDVSIRDILCDFSAEKAAEALLQNALAAGGRDNISLVVIALA